MARRRTSSRIPGLKVWALALTLVLAGWLFGTDDPHVRRTFYDLAEGLLLTDHAGSREAIAGGARIIDGDTLDLNGTRVRLYGIDAPERAQTCRHGAQEWNCGTESRAALARMIGDQPLNCENQDIDRYGRIVATCEAGGVSVNTWMIRNGWAVAYRQYGGAVYLAIEDAARRDSLGLWAGEFVMPWEWRAGR